MMSTEARQARWAEGLHLEVILMNEAGAEAGTRRTSTPGPAAVQTMMTKQTRPRTAVAVPMVARSSAGAVRGECPAGADRGCRE